MSGPRSIRRVGVHADREWARTSIQHAARAARSPALDIYRQDVLAVFHRGWRVDDSMRMRRRLLVSPAAHPSIERRGRDIEAGHEHVARPLVFYTVNDRTALERRTTVWAAGASAFARPLTTHTVSIDGSFVGRRGLRPEDARTQLAVRRSVPSTQGHGEGNVVGLLARRRSVPSLHGEGRVDDGGKGGNGTGMHAAWRGLQSSMRRF